MVSRISKAGMTTFSEKSSNENISAPLSSSKQSEPLKF